MVDWANLIGLGLGLTARVTAVHVPGCYFVILAIIVSSKWCLPSFKAPLLLLL